MSRSSADLALRRLTLVCALSVACILGLITVFLTLASLPAFTDIGIVAFVRDLAWYPRENMFNLVPMIAGSLIVTAIALLMATPLGIAAAIFLSYYAQGFVGASFQRLVELLTGIPSVVFGFWGLVAIVPLLAAWHAPGASVLAAALVLALMILPTIILMSHTAITAVPESYRHAAAALSLDRFAMIFHIVLPAAFSGIITAVLLALGRAIGETMVVLMVAGNVVKLPSSVFDPVRTLTANIALEMAYARDDHRAALFFSGLLLLALVTLLVFIGERFSSVRPEHATAISPRSDQTHAHFP